MSRCGWGRSTSSGATTWCWSGARGRGGSGSESWLGVPIMAGERVLGVVTLERPEAHEFSEADERLLATIAASMGVALENARLFDETKRLLAETEQRDAELAVINEIGAALAKQLDFDAIIDARRRASRLDLRRPRPSTSRCTTRRPTRSRSRTAIEHGERAPEHPSRSVEGLTPKSSRPGAPLRLGTVDEADAHGAIMAGGER